MEIKDITGFVLEQYDFLKRGKIEELLVAQERVYPVVNPVIAAQIGIDNLT